MYWDNTLQLHEAGDNIIFTLQIHFSFLNKYLRSAIYGPSAEQDAEVSLSSPDL